MKASEVEKLVAVFEAAYPNHPTRPETATAYHLALADTPVEMAQAAAAWWIAEEKWFPTAAELRSRVQRLERGVTISDLALAAQLRSILGQEAVGAGTARPALTEATR